jgi:hypothetical protein
MGPVENVSAPWIVSDHPSVGATGWDLDPFDDERNAEWKRAASGRPAAHDPSECDRLRAAAGTAVACGDRHTSVLPRLYDTAKARRTQLWKLRILKG